jgi:hypothetical protein
LVLSLFLFQKERNKIKPKENKKIRNPLILLGSCSLVLLLPSSFFVLLYFIFPTGKKEEERSYHTAPLNQNFILSISQIFIMFNKTLF